MGSSHSRLPVHVTASACWPAEQRRSGSYLHSNHRYTAQPPIPSTHTTPAAYQDIRVADFSERRPQLEGPERTAHAARQLVLAPARQLLIVGYQAAQHLWRGGGGRMGRLGSEGSDGGKAGWCAIAAEPLGVAAVTQDALPTRLTAQALLVQLSRMCGMHCQHPPGLCRPPSPACSAS